jgi:hypothetical protein
MSETMAVSSGGRPPSRGRCSEGESAVPLAHDWNRTFGVNGQRTNATWLPRSMPQAGRSRSPTAAPSQ